MIASLAGRIDDWVIGLASQRLHLHQQADPRSAEAAAWLAREDLFAPVTEPTTGLQFSNRRDFWFTSPVSSPFSGNNRVHGRFIDSGPGWRRQPLAILLHGWNAEWSWSTLFPAMAALFRKQGVSTLMIELPYHGRRRSPPPSPARDFISGDLAHMVEATRQAVADTRALMQWASIQGCPGIGLWGFSLGAWIAGLIACHDTKADCVVLGTPIVDVAESVRDLPFCAPVRQSLARSPLNLSRLNLCNQTPRTRRENILIIESLHDHFVRPASIDALAEAWTVADLWRVRHGHISVWLSRSLVRNTVNWMSARLTSPTGPLNTEGR